MMHVVDLNRKVLASYEAYEHRMMCHCIMIQIELINKYGNSQSQDTPGHTQ